MQSVVRVEYRKQHNSNLKQETMIYDSLLSKTRHRPLPHSKQLWKPHVRYTWTIEKRNKSFTVLS